MNRIAGIAATVIFVALMPLLLITSSVRFVINLPLLYSYGFDRYNIAEYTRIERADLIEAGNQFREYFNEDEQDLIITTYVGGVLVESLYNEREIHHMRDVKALVRGVYLAQMLALLYIAAYIVVGFWLRRAEFWGTLGRDVSRGGKLTLALVVVVGLLALVAFNQVFLLFHLISFSNDFWMLDPRRDYLIAMFPQGFFFDATMLIAFCTIAAAAVLTALPRITRIIARGWQRQQD